GAFVPVDAEPRQVAQDALGRLFGGAGLIRVLDAEEESAAHPARKGPAEERRSGAADVQMAGGRGSEAGDDGVLGHRRERIAADALVDGVAAAGALFRLGRSG